MSKKVIAFTLPQDRPQERTPSEEATADSDNWVKAAAPLNEDEPPGAPPAPALGPCVIDLSARRTLPELIFLIWTFPALATSAWLQQTAELWQETLRPRGE